MFDLGGTLLKAGVQAFGASSQKKAMKAKAAADARAAREGYGRAETMTEGSRKLGGESTNYLSQLQKMLFGGLGKESSFLSAAHKQNLTGIERGRSRDLAGASFLARTSPSAVRGLTLRANRAATDATNAENIGYGMNQQGFADSRMNQFGQVLGMGLSEGRFGTGILSGASQGLLQGQLGTNATRAQGAMGFWDSMGDITGGIAGDISAYKSGKANEALLSGIYDMTKGKGGVWTRNQRDKDGNSIPR